ncbi:MAG: class I SAM-dependent methyltransferase [Candidatus Eisenbacteria bacterium]|nr:class I SAM-dependent methyltransferase [Candidatus Eisenbacteria bacterium]
MDCSRKARYATLRAMPTSEHWQIPRIVDVIVRERPRRVLDVGAGYGKFGILAREYSEVERVDALDANPPRYPVYDHFYGGDLRELDRVLPDDATGYDLALFIDVIEHLEKPEAYRVLDQLTRRARKVLITTPLGFRPQEIAGMPFETHRSGWFPWDFSKRVRVESWRVFPGHFSRWLRLPRMWQLLALVSAKAS